VAKPGKEKTIRASKLRTFFESNTNKPVQVHFKQKQIDLTIRGEVHKHDDQYWITQDNAMTIVDVKQQGSRLSRFFSWPDKKYHVSVTITLGGETLANLTLPMRSKDKLPCSIH